MLINLLAFSTAIVLILICLIRYQIEAFIHYSLNYKHSVLKNYALTNTDVHFNIHRVNIQAIASSEPQKNTPWFERIIY